MKLTTKLIIALSAISFALILVRIVVSNAFAVDGITLANMQNQIASLEKQNMIVKEEVYTASSYTTIASDAATMGFVEEKSEVTLNNTSSIAIRQ